MPRRDGSASGAARPSRARPSDPLIYRNSDTRLRRQLADCLAACADVLSVGRWSTPGPRIPNLGLSAWELVRHAIAGEDIAGQRPFRIIREHHLSTLLVSSAGHATGTPTFLEAVGGPGRTNLLIRTLCREFGDLGTCLTTWRDAARWARCQPVFRGVVWPDSGPNRSRPFTDPLDANLIRTILVYCRVQVGLMSCDLIP